MLKSAVRGAVALITGGASGLGKATVEKFARTGAKVVICDLPTSRGDEIADKLGGDVIFVPTDITSEHDVTTAIKTTKSKFGRLDVCVNCAGTARAHQIYNFNKAKSASLEDFAQLINVNVVGTFNVIRLVAGLMAENKPNNDGMRGVIVNTSAYAAYDGQSGQAGYAAASAGIIGMTLPISRDFMEQGIRVVTLVPGLFKTDMLVGELPDDIQDFLAETVCFPRRFGEPAEYADFVESVVNNPLLNGVAIRIDGGFRSFLYN